MPAWLDGSARPARIWPAFTAAHELMNVWFTAGPAGVVFAWIALYLLLKSVLGLRKAAWLQILSLSGMCAASLLVGSVTANPAAGAAGRAAFFIIYALIFGCGSIFSRLSAVSMYAVCLAASEALISAVLQLLGDAGVLPPAIPVWLSVLPELCYVALGAAACWLLAAFLKRHPAAAPKRAGLSACAAALVQQFVSSRTVDRTDLLLINKEKLH